MSICAPYEFATCYVNLWFWRTLFPLQLVVGTLGNVLNVVILSRRRMRKYSTTVYLIFLAFADMGTLWTTTLAEIFDRTTEFSLRAYSTLLCKTLWWGGYAASGFSVWLIVLMTIERMILTVSPMSAKTSLNVKNATIFACITMVLCMCLAGHLFFGFEVRLVDTSLAGVNGTNISTSIAFPSNVSQVELLRQCVPKEAYRPIFVKVWPLIVVSVIVLIPFIIIVIGNGTILMTLLVQKRRLNKVNPESNATSLKAFKKRKSSTKTLLLICALFIGTTLPFMINLIVSRYVKSPDPYVQATKELITTIVMLLVTCNYTFNFVLYFVSGSLFKSEFKMLMHEINTKVRKLARLAPPETRMSNMATDSSSLQTKKSTKVAKT